MEKLETIKNTLICAVEGQIGNLQEANTEELGQVVDMIKDLDEAMYYCSIVKAMKEAEKEEYAGAAYPTGRRYYHDHFPEWEYDPYDRDMDKHMGRMYYSERQPRNSKGEFTSYGRGKERYYSDGDEGREGSSRNGRGGSGGTYYYTEREMPFDLRDTREGRSGMSRRMYMESKELHKNKNDKIKELDRYMKELGEDIVEMIEDASPEEKQMLEKKLTQLTSKVAQLNV